MNVPPVHKKRPENSLSIRPAFYFVYDYFGQDLTGRFRGGPFKVVAKLN
jgi:hypothetical protein